MENQDDSIVNISRILYDKYMEQGYNSQDKYKNLISDGKSYSEIPYEKFLDTYYKDKKYIQSLVGNNIDMYISYLKDRNLPMDLFAQLKLASRDAKEYENKNIIYKRLSRKLARSKDVVAALKGDGWKLDDNAKTAARAILKRNLVPRTKEVVPFSKMMENTEYFVITDRNASREVDDGSMVTVAIGKKEKTVFVNFWDKGIDHSDTEGWNPTYIAGEADEETIKRQMSDLSKDEKLILFYLVSGVKEEDMFYIRDTPIRGHERIHIPERQIEKTKYNEDEKELEEQRRRQREWLEEVRRWEMQHPNRPVYYPNPDHGKEEYPIPGLDEYPLPPTNYPKPEHIPSPDYPHNPMPKPEKIKEKKKEKQVEKGKAKENTNNINELNKRLRKAREKERNKSGKNKGEEMEI